ANQIASQSRKLKQSFRVPALQLTDDVADIATGTEGAARAGNYDNPRIFFIAQFCEEVCQLVIDLERNCVQTLRTIQRDRSDAIALFVEKRIGTVHALLLDNTLLDQFH